MATNGSAAYSSNGFWKIRLHELITDLVLIAISIYLSHYLRLYTSIVTQETSYVIQLVIVIVQLTLPWYLGFLYGRYLVFYSGFIRKIVQVFAFIIFMMFVGFAINFLTGLPKSSNLSGSDNFIFFALFWVFAIIVAPFLALSGKSAGKGCFIKLTKGDKNGSFYQIVFIFLGSVLFLLGLFILMYYLGKPLGLIASVLLLSLILFLGYKVYGKLKNTYVIHLLDSIAIYIFPVIVFVSLTVWSFICVQTSVTDNLGNHLAFRQIFFILIVNGYIPLRLIQMFNPPLSILNLLLSIISLVIFLSVIH
jgi:hypothetical protein